MRRIRRSPISSGSQMPDLLANLMDCWITPGGANSIYNGGVARGDKAILNFLPRYIAPGAGRFGHAALGAQHNLSTAPADGCAGGLPTHRIHRHSARRRERPFGLVAEWRRGLPAASARGRAYRRNFGDGRFHEPGPRQQWPRSLCRIPPVGPGAGWRQRQLALQGGRQRHRTILPGHRYRICAAELRTDTCAAVRPHGQQRERRRARKLQHIPAARRLARGGNDRRHAPHGGLRRASADAVEHLHVLNLLPRSARSPCSSRRGAAGRPKCTRPPS